MSDRDNNVNLPNPAYTRSEQKKRREAIQKIKDERERKKKKRLKIAGGSFFAFIFLAYWGLMAGKSTNEYAICRTFIEMQQIYPSSLQVIDIDPFDASMRITYLARNPHGSVMASMVECIFRPDPVTKLALDSVNVNREPFEDDEIIAKFNMTIPALLAGDPDLTMPPPIGGDLVSLKRDETY